MVLKIARLFALTAFCAIAGNAQVVINEMLFLPDPASADAIRTHQWVELFNAGSSPADLTNWVLSAGDGSQGASARTLPAVQLPAGAYLVVHFTSGVNQLDFSNGSGDYYTGDDPTVPVWKPTSDEVALYSPNGIVDFLAWATSAAPYQAAAAAADAVTAGIWTKGDYLQASAVMGNVGDLVNYITPGQSIGRDSVSTDTNTSSDFYVNGGRHALDVSPGRQNADTPAFADLSAPPPAGQQAMVRHAARPRDGAPSQWTVLFYFAADSDITGAAFQSAHTIGQTFANLSPATPDVNYLMLFKGRGGGGNRVTVRGQLAGLTPDGKDLSMVAPQQLGNLDMGDPQTLQDFISWGQTTYPAQKYALVILSHGKGWKGVVTDEGFPGKDKYDMLYMGELKEALRHGANFDLIAFDSCMMGSVEVAAQIAPYASYMLANEEVVFAQTFPYGEMIQALNNNPAQTGLALGTGLVDAWAARNGQQTLTGQDKNGNPIQANPLTRWTVALTDLSKIEKLAGDVKTWAQELKAAVPLVQGRDNPIDNVQLLLRNDAFAATRFMDDNFMDLGDFATQVQKDAGIPNCAKTKVATVLADLDGNAVVKLAAGSGFPNVHGLHVYFPRYRTFVAPPQLLLFSANVGAKSQMDPYDKPATRMTDANSHLAAYAPNPDSLPLQATDEEDGSALAAPIDWPRKATPGFRWIADYANEWQNFLTRYYHPVADNRILPVTLPDGTTIQPSSIGGGACSNPVDYISVPSGTNVQISGRGSSDADMPPPGTAPYRYIWDLNSSLDCKDKNGKDCTSPTQVILQDAADAANNNMDQDLDPPDSKIDDKDAVGPVVQYPCQGSNVATLITLMVWDDNHTFPHHKTDPTGLFVHPQTDQYFSTVGCDTGPVFTIYQPTHYYAAYAWPLTAQVTQADGTPAAGMTVSAMPSGNTTVSPVGSGSATGHVATASPHATAPLQLKTDSTGFATMMVSSDPGGSSVTLTVGGKTQTVGFNVIQPNDPPPTGLQVNAPGSLAVNQPASISVSTVGQQGPVSEVTFFALSNNISFTDNFLWGNGRGTQADTDSNGSARVSITPTAGGTAQILAVAGSTIKTLTIPIDGGTPAADTLTVSGTPAVVAVGAKSSLTFTLQAGAQPAAGAKITVQTATPVAGEGGLTFTPAASGNTTQLTTDAKGTATLQFTGNAPGISTLTVTVPGTSLKRTIQVFIY
jgi:hypothetical protein